MKKIITNKFVLFSLGVLFVIGVWFLLSLCFDVSTTIFPSPIPTFKEFFNMLGKGQTYISLGYTVLRVFLGFIISFVCALVIGTIAGNHEPFYQFFKPFITVIKSIPTVALVFLFIALITPKMTPIVVVVILCFPILYEGVVGGIKNVDKQLIAASRVDGAMYMKRILYIKLPLAIPYIVVAIASSFSLSFKIEIMAEVVAGLTKNGLGSSIVAARNNDPTTLVGVFACSLFAILFMLLVTLLEEIVKHVVKRQNIVNFNNN